MKKLWTLFFAFFRIGLFTFGGGFAMLPMLQREVVEKHQWATEQELLDYFAIGQCTPGVIAVNTATFIGYKLYRLRGAIASTLGIIMPSLIIITILAALLRSFADLPLLQNALAGIRIAVAALIVGSVIRLIKSNVKNIFAWIICILAFVFVAILGVSPVFVTIGAGLMGFLFGKWGTKKS